MDQQVHLIKLAAAASSPRLRPCPLPRQKYRALLVCDITNSKLSLALDHSALHIPMRMHIRIWKVLACLLACPGNKKDWYYLPSPIQPNQRVITANYNTEVSYNFLGLY